MTFGARPKPSQMIRMGAIASTGTTWVAMTMGSKARRRVIDRKIAVPMEKSRQAADDEAQEDLLGRDEGGGEELVARARRHRGQHVGQRWHDIFRLAGDDPEELPEQQDRRDQYGGGQGTPEDPRPIAPPGCR